MSSIFKAIKGFFNTLFGGGKSDPPRKPKKDKEKPPRKPDKKDDDRVLPPIDLEEPAIPDEEPQDGGDLHRDEEEEPTPPPPPPPPPEYTSRYAWIIDCGHTEFTPGKRSPKLDDGRQLLEYEINHWVGDRLIKRLRDHNIEVVKTCRPDEFEERIEGDRIINRHGDNLTERCIRANNYITSRPKLFVSIHHNAFGSGWSAPHGTETFIFTRPSNEEASEDLGNTFQRCLVDGLRTTNRGLKRANYQVLRLTAMPACLLEVEFFSNKEKVLLLLEEDFRNKTIDAMEKAILEIEEQGLRGYPLVV